MSFSFKFIFPPLKISSVYFLSWSGSSMSFFFKFNRSFTDKEETDAISLFSLLGEFNFRCGRRDVHIWNPDPLEGFSCNSFFRCQLDHSSKKHIFSAIWRLEFLSK